MKVITKPKNIDDLIVKIELVMDNVVRSQRLVNNAFDVCIRANEDSFCAITRAGTSAPAGINSIRNQIML